MTGLQRPLSGIRILDLSRLLPGPYCTLLLAELGAEVIKIEPPLAGDYARLVPEEFGGEAMFGFINRGKKSLALNYRNPRGREALLRLAGSADALIETFRPGAVKRWGLGYEEMHRRNPRLVYCSLSGYGQSGPYVQRAGHDLNYLAVAGVLGLNGPAGGSPIPPGVQIADLAGGMLAALSIVAALLGRAGSGQGAYLDVAMLDAAVSWAMPFAGSLFLATGRQAGPGQMPLTGGLGCYNVYETADGQHLSLGALEPHFWAAFCNAVGRADLAARQFDPALHRELAALFRTRTRADWLAALAGVDVCVEPVNSIEEMARDPQVTHRGLVRQGAPGTAFPSLPHQEAAPPWLGQHTREVLQNAGLAQDEIDSLASAGVIKIADEFQGAQGR